LLAGGGTTAFVFGALILFSGRPALFQPDIEVIVGIAVGIGSAIAFIIYHALRAHRRQPTTGREELVGKRAVVKTTLEPEGTILHQGELWTAVLDKGRAEPGEEVTIAKFDGLKLYVTKKPKRR
jgi:membrane-bound ClpP family serine protease